MASGVRKQAALTSPLPCLCCCGGGRRACSLFPGELGLASESVVFWDWGRCGRLASLPASAAAPVPQASHWVQRRDLPLPPPFSFRGEEAPLLSCPVLFVVIPLRQSISCFESELFSCSFQGGGGSLSEVMWGPQARPPMLRLLGDRAPGRGHRDGLLCCQCLAAALPRSAFAFPPPPDLPAASPPPPQLKPGCGVFL